MSPLATGNSPEIFKPYFFSIDRTESSLEIRQPLRVKFFQLNVKEKGKSRFALLFCFVTENNIEVSFPIFATE